VTIGDALAEARRQAGLTVTQVSQRTCIRETIIRGIERGDFSACGGDFYARGHIRSIARAVGIDPEPLIREYDATQGSPETITAADVFEPSTPIKIRERRRPNWSVAMLVALAAIVGVATYHFLSGPAKAPDTDASSKSSPPARHHPRKTTVTATHPATPKPRRNVIVLTATSYDCWYQLSTAGGQLIWQGILYAGTSRRWIEHRTVTIQIANPSDVHVRVNGREHAPAIAGQLLTIRYHRRAAA
jgi:transcriptional regulator with XRE-family HTH domain